MKTYYIFNEPSATLLSALQEALEALALARGGEFISCSKLHPLDQHLEVSVPSEEWVRTALLRVKDDVRAVRGQIQAQLGREGSV